MLLVWVIWYQYVEKTPEEVAALVEKKETTEQLRSQRRSQQEQNIQRKKDDKAASKRAERVRQGLPPCVLSCHAHLLLCFIYLQFTVFSYEFMRTFLFSHVTQPAAVAARAKHSTQKGGQGSQQARRARLSGPPAVR